MTLTDHDEQLRHLNLQGKDTSIAFPLQPLLVLACGLRATTMKGFMTASKAQSAGLHG